MPPLIVSKILTALDRDGIGVAQQLVGAGDLALAGALASGGVGIMDTQRRVGIYSAGNLAARTFTVYGTNDDGIAISEAVTGPNNATVSTVLDYKTVTRVAVSGAVGSDVEVGTTGVGATKPIKLNPHISPFSVSLFLKIASGATVNATVQYTWDNVKAAESYQTATGLNWTSHAGMTGKTANADSNLAYPATAVRLVINSGTDAAELTAIQAGR